MNPKLTQKRRLTRGFSLVEFSIVLAVVGVVIGGIWALAANMNNNAKQQKFSDMLTITVGNIRGAYAGKAYFDSTFVPTMMDALTRMNVFPGETVRRVANGVSGCTAAGCSVVISPFGEHTNSNPTVAPPTPYNSLYVCGWAVPGSTRCVFSGGGTPNVPFFAVEVLVPRADCINLILRNGNPYSQPGLTSVYTNGVLRGLPFTLATAVTACSAAINYVDFVYRLTP